MVLPHSHNCPQTLVPSLSVAQRGCPWWLSQWLIMVPWTCFKSTMWSRLKAQVCKFSLMKSQSKASDVLNTNCLNKKFLQQFAFHFLPRYVCRANAFRRIHRVSGLGSFSSAVHSDWDPGLGSGKYWLYLKDLENKNLTYKNLSIALVSWHFIKMLAMKSEPIFWPSRNYKM